MKDGMQVYARSNLGNLLVKSWPGACTSTENVTTAVVFAAEGVNAIILTDTVDNRALSPYDSRQGNQQQQRQCDHISVPKAIYRIS